MVSNPVTGSQCDAIKARTALIDCLAPDRRVEVRVTGTQGALEAAAARPSSNSSHEESTVPDV